jgi:hypothetical protein
MPYDVSFQCIAETEFHFLQSLKNTELKNLALISNEDSEMSEFL